MSGLDKLQKYAATIMAHLEDANIAALKIQGQGKILADILRGFETIRIELQTIDNILFSIDALMSNLRPQ